MSRFSLKRKRRVVMEKMRLADVELSGGEKGRSGWIKSRVVMKVVVMCRKTWGSLSSCIPMWIG